MVCSAIFILDLNGKVMRVSKEVLISRNYRGDIPMEVINDFMPLIYQAEEDGATLTPLLCTREHINFLYIKYNNLYCKIGLN